MSSLRIYKGRYNVVLVNLELDISGDTITAEVRERPNKESDLIATWVVTVTDSSAGDLTIVIDDGDDAHINTDKSEGFMDFKRVSGGHELPVIASPIPVEIVGSVTA